MNQKYIISLGSNQGNSLAILRRAAATLEAAEGLHIEKKSAIYETLPWGKTDQPVFLNAVMEISWEGPADALMVLLLSVEKEFGRTRDVHWGPRTLELDLTASRVIPHFFICRIPISGSGLLCWSRWRMSARISCIRGHPSYLAFGHFMERKRSSGQRMAGREKND